MMLWSVTSPVGQSPWKVAYDEFRHMIYVLHIGKIITVPRLHAPLGTVYVINGSSDRVAAGVIFNIHPANSGKIICGNWTALTNTYVYVDTPTNCTPQHNKDFEFNTWTESPLMNRNSSTPLNSSGNLKINGSGVFTVNFKQPHHLSSDDLFKYLTGAIAAGVGINGAILTVPTPSVPTSKRMYKDD